MRFLSSFALFESNNRQIKVVRWAEKHIPAAELKSQHSHWGGFEMHGLSFTPYDEVGDWRYNMWKDAVQKHHGKQMWPSHYILDVSTLPYDNEGKLIDLALQSYSSNPVLSREAELALKDMKIYITLTEDRRKYDIAEFRILDGSPVIILDDK